jgi:glycosyltransferase involved in cell wall biosynthesis
MLRAAMARVTLVHDYLLVMRGAERTFAAMAEIWPDAPIATLLYDRDGTERRFSDHSITTSWLQRAGLKQRNFRNALPLFQTAVSGLDIGETECVVSSSSAFAHGVARPAGAMHVCYCHTPFRYAWHERGASFAEVPRLLRPALDLLLRRHRNFDRRSAAQVDRFVANGRLTQARIKRFWGREATVLHPPVDVERFVPGEPEDYVLFVGELVRHKRPDVAIEAAAAAGRPIKLVGAGPELRRLKHRYGRQARFLGRVDEDTLARLYASASALVVPGVEEFGIAAVEAQAAGRPVVAVDAGGAQETVVAGRTGLLVSNGGPSALARALREDLTRFDPTDIRQHAQRFGRAAFQWRLEEIVQETLEEAGRTRTS